MLSIGVCSDHTEPAYVTHIRNPCHFVVQLNRNIDRLTTLTETITAYCKTMTGKNDVPSRVEPGKCYNVKRKSDSGENKESLSGHCTNERRVRKRDKKVRRDVI